MSSKKVSCSLCLMKSMSNRKINKSDCINNATKEQVSRFGRHFLRAWLSHVVVDPKPERKAKKVIIFVLRSKTTSPHTIFSLLDSEKSERRPNGEWGSLVLKCFRFVSKRYFALLRIIKQAIKWVFSIKLSFDFNSNLGALNNFLF